MVGYKWQNAGVTQMRHFRVGPLRCDVWPSFACLVSAYQGEEIIALIEVHSTLAFQNNKLAIPEALILVAHTQIHKYAKDSFCSVQSFFTFATVFCVFVLSKPGFLLVNTQMRITKWQDFYLCICKALFVTQIKDTLNHCFFCHQKLQKSNICVYVEPSAAASADALAPLLVPPWLLLAPPRPLLVPPSLPLLLTPLLPSPSPPQLPFVPLLLLSLSGWLLSAPAAASVSACRRCCLPPPLLLLSSGAIATVTPSATAARVPYASTAANAAYFSAAGSPASMFPPLLPLFPLPLHATTSVSIAATPLLLFPRPPPPQFLPWQLSRTKSISLRSFGSRGGRWQWTPW
jgi:hypothetical protein